MENLPQNICGYTDIFTVYSSCHPINSVTAQSTDNSQSSGIIFSSFTTRDVILSKCDSKSWQAVYPEIQSSLDVNQAGWPAAYYGRLTSM